MEQLLHGVACVWVFCHRLCAAAIDKTAQPSNVSIVAHRHTDTRTDTDTHLRAHLSASLSMATVVCFAVLLRLFSPAICARRLITAASRLYLSMPSPPLLLLLLLLLLLSWGREAAAVDDAEAGGCCCLSWWLCLDDDDDDGDKVVAALPAFFEKNRTENSKLGRRQ